MQKETPPRHLVLVILICSCCIFGAASDPTIHTTSGEETCSIIPTQTMRDIQSTLSLAGTKDCPIYFLKGDKTDDDRWTTSQPDAVVIEEDGYYNMYHKEEDSIYWICRPDSLFNACKNISLPGGWHLEGYQYFKGMDTYAKIYALPENTHLLSPRQAFNSETRDETPDPGDEYWWPWGSHIPWPPAPPYADPDIMTHITGDDTPLSYVEASLLSRELDEIGTDSRFSSYRGTTAIIDSAETIPDTNWTKQLPSLKEPIVCCSDSTCSVTWYTYNAINSVVECNVDVYQRGSYEVRTNTTTIASGELKLYY